MEDEAALHHMTDFLKIEKKMENTIILEAEKRKSSSRSVVQQARKTRNEKLENEAKSGLEQFEELTGKWTVASAKETVGVLRDALIQQQQLCNQMIENKNKLISELQQELKEVDKCYMNEIKKMEEDVDLFIAMMKEDAMSLKQAFRKNLDHAEKVFNDERNALLTKNKEKWEQHRQQRHDKELELLQQRIKLLDEHDLLLQNLQIKENDEYIMKKMKLDNEIEDYDQKLQKVKASNLLHQLTLNQDLKELKKRTDESAIIKAEQKRKMTKLHDVLHKLKNKCANQERQSQEEFQLLLDALKRSTQKYYDIQEKLRKINVNSAKCFEDMWLMKEEEGKILLQKVLEIDQLIHEQILGVKWVPPSLPFLEHSGPFHAQRAAEQAAAHSGEGGSTEISGVQKRTMTRMDQKTCHQLMLLSEKLQDKSDNEFDFLIGADMLKVLPLLEEDKHYTVKLYSIFKAMGIKKDQDIFKMAELFVQFAKNLSEEGKESIVAGVSEMDSSLANRNDILMALRVFTEQHCRPKEPPRLLENRDFSKDASYWQSIANVLPESRLKVWNALEKTLDEYHTVLTERSHIVEDGQRLKKRNMELRRRLQQFQGQSKPGNPSGAVKA